MTHEESSPPIVDYTDLELAMQFLTGGDIIGAQACISRETGKVYLVSGDSDLDEEIPEDIDDPDRYAEIPAQRDLDPGKRLVLQFAAGHLPDDYEKVESSFSRKGAYARYKDLLEERGKLEEWYRYEQAAVEEALVEWAEMEGFSVEKSSSDTT